MANELRFSSSEESITTWLNTCYAYCKKGHPSEHDVKSERRSWAARTFCSDFSLQVLGLLGAPALFLNGSRRCPGTVRLRRLVGLHCIRRDPPDGPGKDAPAARGDAGAAVLQAALRAAAAARAAARPDVGIPCHGTRRGVAAIFCAVHALPRLRQHPLRPARCLLPTVHRGTPHANAAADHGALRRTRARRSRAWATCGRGF